MALGAIELFLRWIVPPIIVSLGRKKILCEHQKLDSVREEKNNNSPHQLDAPVNLQLIALLTTRTIFAGAMLEGAIFFLLIVSLIEHSLLAISSAALLWMMLIAHFPTRIWVEEWLENQRRLLEEEQRLNCP